MLMFGRFRSAASIVFTKSVNALWLFTPEHGVLPGPEHTHENGPHVSSRRMRPE